MNETYLQHKMSKQTNKQTEINSGTIRKSHERHYMKSQQQNVAIIAIPIHQIKSHFPRNTARENYGKQTSLISQASEP